MLVDAETRRRVAPAQTEGGVADALASAVESADEEASGRKPELSAATGGYETNARSIT